MKVYEYSNCSSCKKALKWLESHGIEYKAVPIREKPPSVAELKKVHKAVGDIKRLFNTSGKDYRELGIKDKLPKLSDAQICEMLSKNGNLVKRPFVPSVGLVGFKENEWEEALL